MALLGIVVAAFLGRAGVVLVVTVLLVLIGADLWLAAPLGALRLRRSGAEQTRLGEPAEVQLAVTNTGARRLRGALRDVWVPSAGATPYEHRLDLPAGESRRLTTTLVPTRRGPRGTAHVTVRSSGPLGLAARQGRLTRAQDGRHAQAAPWQLTVLPAFSSRRYLPEKLARLRQLDGMVAVNGRGQGTEFDSLRAYVDGDDVRSIDWRATARRDAVVVRTWRPERDRRCVLVLDTGRTSAARVGDEPRLDAAIDACLLLGAVAARGGDRVDLLALDSAVRAAVDSSTRGSVLPRLVTAMTPLSPRLVETDVTLLVGEVLRRVRKRALVVVFTALDASVTEGLLAALAPLVSRHVVVVASVADPAVEVLATGRADAEAVYDAAAAQRSLAERAATADRLRRRGVVVVDAPPDRFASVVTDAYLDLKAEGRL